ncbi:MAG: hypothetical protein ABJF50_02770 [Paracoccaceae bacterium]
MFFKKKTPKSGAARLEQEMASITDQAIACAKALRDGRALSPITHAKTETLFAEKNAEGETVFNHYHFTDDMNKLDPEAQIHLMRLFGQIITFNEMLEHPGVEKRLDWIAANASFFERFFARAELSTDILMNKAEAEIEKKIQAAKAGDRTRIQIVLESLFEPETIATLVPRSSIPLMIAMGKPHEEGQKFINGVYFSAQAAPAVMAWLASLQSQSLHDGQDNNPAHA